MQEIAESLKETTEEAVEVETDQGADLIALAEITEEMAEAEATAASLIEEAERTTKDVVSLALAGVGQEVRLPRKNTRERTQEVTEATKEEEMELKDVATAVSKVNQRAIQLVGAGLGAPAEEEEEEEAEEAEMQVRINLRFSLL